MLIAHCSGDANDEKGSSDEDVNKKSTHFDKSMLYELQTNDDG
jgi:hypothetical protein